MSKVECEPIILVHITCKEERECTVLGASDSWKLYLSLGFAGVYWFCLKRDRLLKTEYSRVPLLWCAKDKERVEQIWKMIKSNGVYQPPPLKKTDVKIAKAVAESLRNPSEAAIEHAEKRGFR
jgi:hypothetical protein